MKIVIDSAIPFIGGVFEPFAEVVYMAGSEITSAVVRDANALIIRTRTRCDAKLLDGSSVEHIATATIGFDHIDLDYCAQQGISVSTAAVCNARGVLQWFGAAISKLSKGEGWQPFERTLGVVGVGNVGSLIAEYAASWGFKVICCDPPRAEREGIEEFVSLNELLQSCDIVTLHTPLDSSTYHMINSSNIGFLKSGGAIINSSRGEVIETQALLDYEGVSLLFDVWESEPAIDTTLLQRAVVSTSHIAGYTLQGKANGTAIVVADIAARFGIPIDGWYPNIERNTGRGVEWEEMARTIAQYIDIEQESATLKSDPEAFERLRNGYQYRNEYF